MTTVTETRPASLELADFADSSDPPCHWLTPEGRPLCGAKLRTGIPEHFSTSPSTSPRCSGCGRRNCVACQLIVLGLDG